MNLKKLHCTLFLAVLPAIAHAEGSYQTGLNQPLLEQSSAYGFSQYVDIITVGEVINVSVCGEADSDSITIQIFDPGGNQVVNSTLASGNVSCADPFNAPLTNPARYTSTTTGAYEIRLENDTAQDWSVAH